MPEIKHNFTSGKMNKDLDERLVPNGEYRDAMNIEVSTSEGSDVGTVQNILGNSLIEGLDYLTSDTKCVGSIADEKNDTLYWFTIGQAVEISLVNGSFSDNTNTEYTQAEWSANTNTLGIGPTNNLITADEWLLVADAGGDQLGHGISISGNKLTRSATNNGSNSSARQLVNIIEGVEYEISYKRKYLGGNSITNIFINFDENSNDPATSTTLASENDTEIGNTVTVTDSFVAGYTGVMEFRVFFIGDFHGWIDNVELSSTTKISRIFQYDKNIIKPVFVDLNNFVLKFDPTNIITGINIIDDMLFWTDNQSEPKKINIPRSIDGTDPGGLTHTIFINEKTGEEILIKEEHITVIKKQPKTAPKIELVSERDINLNYSGIMRITSQPNPDTIPRASVNGGINNITNDQNNSSMHIDDDSWVNHHYDFSQLSVGDNFDTKIETNIAGESGFVLDWAVGDILVFKEFGGTAYDQAPQVPLTEYSVKAKIIESRENIFTDTPTQLLQNHNFDIVNGNANFPYSWGASIGWSTWATYDTMGVDGNTPGDGVLHIDVSANGGYQKVFYKSFGNKNAINFIEGVEYKLEFTIDNYQSGKISCQAVVPDYVFNPQNTVDPNSIWKFSALAGVQFFAANGTYSQTFTLIKANAENTSGIQNVWPGYRNKVMLEVHGPSGFDGTISNISLERTDVADAQVRCKVLGFDGTPEVVAQGLTELKYVVDKLDVEEKIFEFKFPRIAYRYRYQDGEYSCISPFSQIAFLPGVFDYHPKKGYNIGMSNRVKEIKVSNFMNNVPHGVNEVDIIYKEDTSPNIYIIDTIKPLHTSLTGFLNNFWDEEEYVVKSEQISRAIESNQLLRPWDNVPRKALAQEITGNRIVYGNYTHGYDLKINDNEDYYPDFNFDFDNTNITNDTLPSIKSLREYQVGVVFVDDYGRETPVISNLSGTKKLTKENAHKQNKLRVGFNDAIAPDNLKYFKFFVKETSSQYYNMAMDRYYDAEDGQVWLSFPSSDRNKIDIDDFVILKKALESDTLVTQEARYKVLDIQNEAPEFIKRNLIKLDEISHLDGNVSREIFTDDTSEIPVSGVDSFKVKYKPFSEGSSGSFGDINDDIYVDFKNSVVNKTSKIYKINSVFHNFKVGGSVTMTDARYTFRLSDDFDEDINFITDDPSGANPTKVEDGVVLRVYKSPSQNLAKFDGRFFVKIDIDPTISASILSTSQTLANPTYRTTMSKKLYMMRSDHNELHHEELMFGDGALGEYGGGSNPGFGRMAPFFRNYKEESNEKQYNNNATPSVPINVGQYIFGGNNSNWLKELAWVTTEDAIERSNTIIDNVKSGNEFPGGTSWEDGKPKVADSNDWGSGETRFNNTVWFIDGGPFSGTRTASPQHNYSFHWNWTNASDGDGNGLDVDGNKAFMHLSTNVYNSDFNGTTNNFWNVGKGATEYDGSKTVSFVEKLNPGEKFRFKEDPTYEIYNVIKLERLKGNLRHTCPSNGNNPNGASYATENLFKRYLDSSGSLISPADYDLKDGDYTNATSLLSPNTTTTFVTQFVNSSGETEMSWNPTLELGPIANGLELSIVHSTYSSHPGFGSDDDVYVEVDSLTATNHDLTTRNIEVGMILTSHSNGTHTLVGDALTSVEAPLLVWKIAETGNTTWKIHLCGYARPLVDQVKGPDGITNKYLYHEMLKTASPVIPLSAQTMVFQQPSMNGYSQYSCNRINAQLASYTGTGVFDPNDDIDNGIPRIMPVYYTLEFVEEVDTKIGLPDNPAIWETQPKENTPLDIYYEASGYNPLRLTQETINLAVPIGSSVTHPSNPLSIADGTTVYNHGYGGDPLLYDNVNGIQGGWYVDFSPPMSSFVNNPYINGQFITIGDFVKITKPDNSSIMVKILGWEPPNVNTSFTNRFYIDVNLYSTSQYILNWHNCFSFGNGVESNRVRDNFNAPFIANGVKVSTTVSSLEGEQHRKYGLIYSGIYNGTSETNNLNQFIQAEKITKDINPIYGSIQKLHSRDTDLVTICEDKVLKILANKDAVFNADGNPQLTANQNVLGQTMPFVGEFGISTNPESFVSEAYRAYFTDKVRGSVMRLSKDGLTPISMHGMKDWFRDNLKTGGKLIGSYDDRKDEYNVTVGDITTVSFNENVKGWVSFKSFIPENAVSCANDYYTMKDGKLWKHYDEGVDRNTFYNNFTNSSINVLLNDSPSSIKSYHTLDYEGSQSKVTGFLSLKVVSTIHPTLQGSTSRKFFHFDESEMSALLGRSDWHKDVLQRELKIYRNGNYLDSWRVKLWNQSSLGPTQGYGRRHTKIEATGTDWEVGDVLTLEIQSKSVDYFNQKSKNGWHVTSIKTDEKEGSLSQFIEKEGKWFNYIKGIDNNVDKHADFGAFNFQGLGKVEWINTNRKNLTFDSINASLQIGDTIYYQTLTEGIFDTLDSNSLESAGSVVDISAGKYVKVNGNQLPSIGDYAMFVKNQTVNMSGLSGYYANAIFENNSTEKAELFSISSEITESSK